MSDSFCDRLRHERERRQIPLRSIAEGTKIGIGLLEALERGDVSRWPSGIFRKSFIRSYAAAIGLDPDPIVREFIERYPDPLELELNRPSPPAPSSAGSVAVKLTINWKGSTYRSIARLPDWKIVRMLLH
jgi:cytoskeletal protein RodZ